VFERGANIVSADGRRSLNIDDDFDVVLGVNRFGVPKWIGFDSVAAQPRPPPFPPPATASGPFATSPSSSFGAADVHDHRAPCRSANGLPGSRVDAGVRE
jgi:hypothetical protein